MISNGFHDRFIMDLEREVLASLSDVPSKDEVETDPCKSYPQRHSFSSVRQPNMKKDIIRKIYESDSISPVPSLGRLKTNRLVQRNMPHHQSNNIFSVKQRSKIRLERSNSMPQNLSTVSHRYIYRFLPQRWQPTHWALYFHDWFHSFLRMPTVMSMFLWATVWTSFVLFFASIYFFLDYFSDTESSQCKLSSGFDFTFSTAFGFSLLTTTTVGYTLPGGTNAFFETCPWTQITIYAQCIISLLFNAFLLSFLFTRISRAQNRARKVIFGDKAIIKLVQAPNADGNFSHRWTFEFKCFDLDPTHPLVESHVRVYASFLPNRQQLQVCRLLRPSDTFDGWVFTSIPYTVVHEIDTFSPLSPKKRMTATEFDPWFNGSHGLDRRSSDARTLQTARWICPICSQPCTDLSSLMKHIRYMKIKNKCSKMMGDLSHESIPDHLLNSQSTELDVIITEDLLKKHLEHAEIICIIEGVDPITSGTFQALQSYTLDDIVFSGSFQECIYLKDDQFVVDLDSFHRIIPTS